MPVALPFLEVLGPILMLLLALLATVLVLELLRHISFHVPGYGDVHIPGIARIARYVENGLRDWFAPHLHVVTGWLDNVATHIREFPREVADYATAHAKQLDHYVHVRSHEVIAAFLRPVRDLAHDAATIATGAAAAVVELRGDARAWVRDLRGDATGWLAALEAKAHGWVVDLRHDAFNAIDAVHRQVVADVLPRIGTLEDAIPGLRRGIDDLRGLYSDVAAWFLPIAAVFSGAAALALLQHVHSCRARSDRLCLTDPSFLDELLGLVFLGVGISELQAFIRTAAPVAGGLADEFIDRS